MKICNKCKNKIPSTIKIDGKKRNLQNRKFCLDCSPFGQHNTRDITKPKIHENRKDRSNGKAVTKYRRRLKWKLIEYKGGKCERCGYNKRVARAYDFHHRNPEEKDFSISSSLSLSFEKLKVEVDKCDLLCRNCHAEVHHELDRL